MPGTRTIGAATDLMLLRLQGAEVLDRGDHLVVRTPDQPSFHWGNFLLYPGPPGEGDLDRWCAAFRDAFPDAEHLSIALDTADGVTGVPGASTAAGLVQEVGVVLAATSVMEPPRGAAYLRPRTLETDDDWRRAVELEIAYRGEGEAEDAHRDFVEARMAAMRRLQESGRGAWFGAFADERMVSGLGVFTDGGGTARYQSVGTHPDFRGRGLAGTLVRHAGVHALEELGARRLVIVADRDSQAARIYRSVGFADVELAVQYSRP